jgi:ectoine hydroxylase-related dioxygenase (phytanoyl-CoA dioxygenase family)
LDARNFPYKLLDFHLDDQTIRDLSSAQPLMRALHRLLGARPLVCNSLFFERGSQQYPHFDTFFMPSRTPNMMAASWIAIDPVTHTNGPVYYYPKSHFIEPYRFSHGKMNAIFSELETGAAAHIRRIIEEHGLRREVFLADPGDVLIWHAQLLHGGSEILDPVQTRCSLVTHYWTERDFPDADQRWDLGDERWILKRDPMHVIDQESLAAVDAFLATLSVTDEMRACVPDSFDARLYLAQNQDILAAGANPWLHYANHGLKEGRNW